MATIEVEVDVEVSSGDEEAARDEARAAINRLVIAPMPTMVVGAWVGFVESEEDDPRNRRRK